MAFLTIRRADRCGQAYNVETAQAGMIGQICKLNTKLWQARGSLFEKKSVAAISVYCKACEFEASSIARLERLLSSVDFAIVARIDEPDLRSGHLVDVLLIYHRGNMDLVDSLESAPHNMRLVGIFRNTPAAQRALKKFALEIG